jgi:hypothetical protein
MKLRYSKQAATRQGVTLEEYLKAQSEGKRYCKVHGLQDIKAYHVTPGKDGKAPTQHCKKCETASRRKHRVTVNAGCKRRSQKLRLEILRHYSPELQCVICGEGHWEFLALDHIEGGGSQKRKAASLTGDYWTSIKRAGYPDGLRVLCHNCNLKHGCRDFYGTGSRKKAKEDLSQHHLTVAVRKFNERHPERSREQAKSSSLKRKAEVLAHYGGSCACCGLDDLAVLSIDHIDGGGCAHRRELKARGEHFGYHWLKKNGFPAGFRVLCVNCNFARGLYGYCPHEREEVIEPPRVSPGYVRVSDATGEAQAVRLEETKRGKALKLLEVREAALGRGRETLDSVAKRYGMSQRKLRRILDGEHWSSAYVPLSSRVSPQESEGDAKEQLHADGGRQVT